MKTPFACGISLTDFDIYRIGTGKGKNSYHVYTKSIYIISTFNRKKKD
jgi:hypothetical protein